MSNTSGATLKNLICKYHEIIRALLKRIFRKSVIKAEMMNINKCLDILSLFVKALRNGGGLENMCYKHLIWLNDLIGL